MAECREFIDALRWREGELARERGPLEGLREGTRGREDDAGRGGFRGVDGVARSGDLGAWETCWAGGFCSADIESC